MRAIERRGLFPAGHAATYVRRMRAVQDAHRAALARHWPRRYRGRTIIVRAGDQPDADRALLRADPTGGWGAFLAEAPELLELPGDHDGLLRPPRVGALAQLIRDRALAVGRVPDGTASAGSAPADLVGG